MRDLCADEHAQVEPVTPIKLKLFTKWIQGFIFQEYLLIGLRYGFRIGYEGPRYFRSSPNLKSCKDFPEIISEKIMTERNLGRIQGPFNIQPFPNIRVSPIGVVPKKRPGEFRLIHHLSYPEGNSVNDFICEELSTVKYSSFDDAVALVLALGPGCLLSKTDIESAYRILPVHRDDHELLGFKWGDQYYYDKCLTMGLRSSAAIFDRFSSGLKWIAQSKLGISFITHILDDFLILGPANSDNCQKQLHTFLAFCEQVGVPIKADKTVGPCTCLTFMGLELDSRKMEVRLPKDKLEKVRYLLSTHQKCRKIKLHTLQSIIGLLNFCCIVVRPGRCFLRRLIDLTRYVSQPNHRVTLNKDARRDLAAWQLFIQHFNGSSLLLKDKWLTSSSLDLYTDAAGSVGFGAIFGKQWLMGKWPNHLKDFPITFKEIFPIVLAFEIWGPNLKNQCVTLHIDNVAAVYILNKQSSKDKYIMCLVRRFVLACMKNNILTHCIHIEGCRNTLSDLVSRSKVADFHRLAPQMDKQPTPVPESLLRIEV